MPQNKASIFWCAWVTMNKKSTTRGLIGIKGERHSNLWSLTLIKLQFPLILRSFGFKVSEDARFTSIRFFAKQNFSLDRNAKLLQI